MISAARSPVPTRNRRVLRQSVRDRLPDVRQDGTQENPLYADLARATGAVPRWNFHKYLIDRSGQQVLSFDTRVAPSDPKLVEAVEKMLSR